MDTEKENTCYTQYAAGIILGFVIGLLFGIFTNMISLGIVISLPIGVAIGFGFRNYAMKNKQNITDK